MSFVRFQRLSAILLVTMWPLVGFYGCGSAPQLEVLPPPEVFVGHPLEKNVTEFLEFRGITEAREFVEVRARAEGWLDKVNFEPGSRVNSGSLLFVIDPRPYQVRVDQSLAALKGQEAELLLKQANLRRAQQLLSTSSISQQQFDVQSAEEAVARSQVGIAEAAVEKANLDLSYTRVTAPINGRLSRNYVDVGNLVGAKEKTLLTEIINDDTIFVYFDVSERDFLMLMRRWPRIQTKTPSNLDKPAAYLLLADQSGMPHEGRIDYVEPRLDPSTGTLRVRAVFPNENRLLVSGLFGRIRVRLGEKKALLVPELAVGIAQAGRFVLVVNEDNIVEQRLVETGQLEGTLRVIEKGLKPDERVVVNAIQRATPGAKVTPRQTSIEPAPQGPGTTTQSSGM